MLPDTTPVQPDDTPGLRDRASIDLNTVLIYAHGVQHGTSCGERVTCPMGCDPFGPHYLPAERQVRRSGTFILCHACGGSWREIGA